MVPKDTTYINSLAQRIGKGDTEALAELYRVRYSDLYRYALRVAGPSYDDLAEEVVQNLFLWVACHYERLLRIRNIDAYFYRSIRQNMKEAISAKIQKDKARQNYLSKKPAIHHNSIPSIEQELINKEQESLRSKELNNAIGALPDYQREALHLRYYEGRSYQEIASLLSTNEQVVRNYVSRAIKGLKKSLGVLSLLLF